MLTYQFSYQLNIADQQQLDMPALYDQLRKMGHEVLDLVDPGWTMFWVFGNQEFAPKAGADNAVGDLGVTNLFLKDTRSRRNMPGLPKPAFDVLVDIAGYFINFCCNIQRCPRCLTQRDSQRGKLCVRR